MEVTITAAGSSTPVTLGTVSDLDGFKRSRSAVADRVQYVRGAGIKSLPRGGISSSLSFASSETCASLAAAETKIIALDTNVPVEGTVTLTTTETTPVSYEATFSEMPTITAYAVGVTVFYDIQLFCSQFTLKTA